MIDEEHPASRPLTLSVNALCGEYAARHGRREHRAAGSWTPGRCVCGAKVTVAGAREVTLPNGRAGWEGKGEEGAGPRRRPAPPGSAA